LGDDIFHAAPGLALFVGVLESVKDDVLGIDYMAIELGQCV
jgi:hypothetical protein